MIAIAIALAVVGVAAVVAVWDVARRVLARRAAPAPIDGEAIARRQMDWEAKHAATLSELTAKLSELEMWRRDAKLARLGGRRG